MKTVLAVWLVALCFQAAVPVSPLRAGRGATHVGRRGPGRGVGPER